MPPKNNTSVARKSHMPKVDASFCCSTSSNWWRSARLWLANLHFLPNRIVVGIVSNDRGDVEIFGWRRRCGLPLEAGCAPRVVRGELAVAHGPDEVNSRDDITYSKYRGACCRKHVVDLEFRWIRVIAPRHPQVAHDELREESQIETQKHHQRGKLGPGFRIHAAGDFGPPVVQAAKNKP